MPLSWTWPFRWETYRLAGTPPMFQMALGLALNARRLRQAVVLLAEINISDSTLSI
jgi:hypothetical protein